MDDMDDDDLSRFTAEEEDRIKPIDAGEEPPYRPRGMGTGFASSRENKPEEKPTEPEKTEPPPPTEQTDNPAPSNPPPAGGGGSGGGMTQNPPPNPAPNLPPENESNIGALEVDNPPPLTGNDVAPAPSGESGEEKKFMSNEDFLSGGDNRDFDMPPSQSAGMAAAMQITNVDNSIAISKNEQLDLVDAAPALKRITIGAGWDHKAFEEEAIDIDLSLFLLDKTEMTRIDEDFIFYNNDRACDGAIQHQSDSRSGAGDGDDESIFVDLNGIPFDILKIILVLSVYDPEIKGRHFGMVKNMFLRVIDKDANNEIMRYRIDPEDQKGGNAMIVGVLIREGPKWIYEAKADLSHSGLAKIATDYGLIIKELQTTGEEVLGEAIAQQQQKEQKNKSGPDNPDEFEDY